jgi:hypothetical protein
MDGDVGTALAAMTAPSVTPSYRGVFNIDNFTFSEANGVSFDFVGGIPKISI